MTALRGHLAGLFREIEGNPRLQWGLLACALLLLLWLWDVTRTGRIEAWEDVGKARARLSQVESIASQGEWAERADAAEALLARLQAELPAAESPGLAQAAFQSWLSADVSSISPELRLLFETPATIDGHPGLVRLAANINGPLAPDRAIELVHRLERRTDLVVIPQIRIRAEPRTSSLNMTVHAFYSIEAESGGNG